MRAKSAKINILKASDLDVEENRLGLNGSPTQVVKIFSPERKTQAQIFNGSAEDSVEKLLEILGNNLC